MRKASIFLLGAILVASVSGCGGAATILNPCERRHPDELCGADCLLDQDCGPDLYCGPENTCIADCAPGGGHCPGGFICGAHGRCIGEPGDGGFSDGSDWDAESCGDITVDLELVIPIVVLLIDQSGSMTSNFGGVSRWAAVREALVNDTDGVVTVLQDRVMFGATLYTSNGGFDGGQCPILTREQPDMNNHPDIQDLLDNNSPSGDTPTGESIEEVVPDLLSVPVDPDSIPPPLVIVLCTDGEPDTCTVPNPQNGQPEALAGVQNAYTQGVETFVLSVGSGVSDDHLQDMANAGVGKPLNDPDPAPFYVANSQTEMVDAFDEIIRGTRECVFTVNGTVDLDLASQGDVRLNGQSLVYGTEWQMVDEHTLELLGDACDTFLNEDSVSLSATFPCGSVVIR